MSLPQPWQPLVRSWQPLIVAAVLAGACAGPTDQQNPAEDSPTGAPPQADEPRVPGGAGQGGAGQDGADEGEPDSFSVLGTGDVLIHPPLIEQAAKEAGDGRDHDFGPMLAGVAPAISEADLAICHLEVPLAPSDGPFTGWPDFSAPPELAEALAETGYDACSTASNHTLDQGADGVQRTLDGLDEAGIAHAGSARTEDEAAAPTILDVEGVSVGHVSYTFGFNGHPKPEGEPWIANRIDRDAIAEEAERARQDGAEVVIASLHWGPEYEHEPEEDQRQLAKGLLEDEDVDLILGHHAHVVQPIEQINDRWVAYGLGNHIAHHAEPRGTSEEGIAARFEFTRTGEDWSVAVAEYVPTLVDLGPPVRMRELTGEEVDPRATEALERTRSVVLEDGAEADGLRMRGE